MKYKRLYKDGTRGSQLYTSFELREHWLHFVGCKFIEYTDKGEITGNIFNLFEIIKN